MTPTPLCDLAIKYGTDKCGKHQYTPVYYDLLKDKKVKRVLEVGVFGGASLRMWAEFFPEAEIIGFDIDPQTFIKEDRITCVQCDQSSVSSICQAVHTVGGEFELIVDDGSHIPEDQIRTAWTLLPYLSPGGIYVIEDVGAHEFKVFPEAIIKHLPDAFECLVPDLPPGDPEKLIVISRR